VPVHQTGSAKHEKNINILSSEAVNRELERILAKLKVPKKEKVRLISGRLKVAKIETIEIQEEESPGLVRIVKILLEIIKPA